MNKIYLSKKTYISDFGDVVSDTGFCNRLLLWDMIQNINKRNNYQHEICLHKYDSPERDEINLYYTSYFTEIPSNITTKMSFEDYEKIAKDGDIFPNRTFIVDFGVERIDYHMGESIQETCLNEITPQNEKIKYFIADFANEYIGIHIRRFNGVNHPKDFSDYLPIQQKNIYDNLIKKKEELEYELPFIGDSSYFYCINNIIKKTNRKVKFYISHDMPDYFYDYYKQKFGNDIIYTRTDFYSELPIMNQQQKNIFDLFFLANTKYKILSGKSSWSYVSQIYNQNSVFCYINYSEQIKEFMDNFNNSN